MPRRAKVPEPSLGWAGSNGLHPAASGASNPSSASFALMDAPAPAGSYLDDLYHAAGPPKPSAPTHDTPSKKRKRAAAPTEDAPRAPPAPAHGDAAAAAATTYPPPAHATDGPSRAAPSPAPDISDTAAAALTAHLGAAARVAREGGRQPAEPARHNNTGTHRPASSADADADAGLDADPDAPHDARVAALLAADPAAYGTATGHNNNSNNNHDSTSGGDAGRDDGGNDALGGDTGADHGDSGVGGVGGGDGGGDGAQPPYLTWKGETSVARGADGLVVHVPAGMVLGPGGYPIRPPVGSEIWHKFRRDNHKEVERRRRETINEGINELAKVVPGCEKNKGSILARAVQYIHDLRARDRSGSEKRTFETSVLEQAVAELTAVNKDLQAQLRGRIEEGERLRGENEGLRAEVRGLRGEGDGDGE